MKQWTNAELINFIENLSYYTNIFNAEGKVALERIKDIIAENEQLKKQIEMFQFFGRNDQGLV